MKAQLRLLIVVGLISSAAQASPGLRAGVTFGATYTKLAASSGYTSTGGVGFPLIGINVVANFARFGLRSYLESQRYQSSYSYNYASGYSGTTVSSTTDLVSFVTLPSFYLGAFYFGAGGGWGYSRNGDARATIPWLAFGLGVEINKFLFIEVRPQFDMTQPSIFSNMYTPLTVGIQFFDAPK